MWKYLLIWLSLGTQCLLIRAQPSRNDPQFTKSTINGAVSEGLLTHGQHLRGPATEMPGCPLLLPIPPTSL